ncbi:DUF2628 domain-containing protein [Oricola sp.]|uniref:DUF2628 domain-containing protein n=1 Tax=Oricola sp. TaxID=1979950 RepID=UPI003BAAF221
MASYVVMAGGEGSARGDRTEFVRDEFAPFALILPLFWLIWHRLWFAALMVLLALVGIGLVGERLQSPGLVLAVNLLLGVLVALEGPAWRLARLRRGGLADAGTVVAESLLDAEHRWFARRPVAAAAAPATAMKVAPQRHDTGSDFLFGFGQDTGR